MQRLKSTGMVALAAVGAAGAMAMARGESPAAAASDAVFATVDGKAITVEMYDTEMGRAYREKFYHGRPPESQISKLRRDVGDTLIDRQLLLAEAKRRGIEPDAAKVAATLAEFDERNRDSPEWRKRRAELLPLLMQGIREQNVLAQLERAVREVTAPSEAQLRAYFEQRPEQFTEPERLRLSVILLKIEPGAPQEERDRTLEDARALRQRLAEGADFATLARDRSGDATAAQGGDMGYLHRGMLPDALHAQIDKLVPGALSEPTLLLEGIALFRLAERVAPKLRTFEDSRERTAKLWNQQQSQQQWSALKARLRAGAAVEVLDRSRYPPVEAKGN